MKKLVVGSIAAAAVAGSVGYLTAVNQKERYVIYEKPGVVSAKSDRLKAAKEELKVTALMGPPPFIKDLKNHKAFVANLSASRAKEISEKHDLVVEKDQIAKMISSCAPKPTPAPPPPEPPQTPPVPRAEIIPWGIKHIHAPEAWLNGASGQGVTVCVVDTGVELTHPDLKDQIAGGEDFTLAGSYADNEGHGTHVAGTIAAAANGEGVIGVAPKAKLWVAKVLDHEGFGYYSDIADGIRACTDAGVDVINMSLGGPSDMEIMSDAVKYAHDEGVILVAAAGNESSAAPSYPAYYQEVLSISAVDQDNNFAYFSNYSGVDFTAPGVDIESTVPGWTFAEYSGTSMASPHVAGVVALMFSAGKSRLVGIDIGLSEMQQGKGLINAEESIK